MAQSVSIEGSLFTHAIGISGTSNGRISETKEPCSFFASCAFRLALCARHLAPCARPLPHAPCASPQALVVHHLRYPDNIRIAKLVQRIPRDGGEAVHHRSALTGLKPVFLSRGQG